MGNFTGKLEVNCEQEFVGYFMRNGLRIGKELGMNWGFNGKLVVKRKFIRNLARMSLRTGRLGIQFEIKCKYGKFIRNPVFSCCVVSCRVRSNDLLSVSYRVVQRLAVLGPDIQYNFCCLFALALATHSKFRLGFDAPSQCIRVRGLVLFRAKTDEFCPWAISKQQDTGLHGPVPSRNYIYILYDASGQLLIAH